MAYPPEHPAPCIVTRHADGSLTLTPATYTPAADCEAAYQLAVDAAQRAPERSFGWQREDVQRRMWVRGQAMAARRRTA